MNTMEDQELLKAYRDRGSQEAFAELVNRHLPLVYGTCRRRLRDHQRAEDVTQSVFLLLARRAGTIKPEVVIAGWLVLAAHYACSNAERSDSVRERHERAAAMERSDVVSTEPPPADDAVALDRALARLSRPDREALMVRFYEGHSVETVAARLGIGAAAAAKRLSRAVQRLRHLLNRTETPAHTETAGTTGLAALIASMKTTALPEGLARRVTDVATGKVIASLATTTITEGVLKMLRQKLFALAAASTGVVLGLGGLAIVLAAPATQPASSSTATPPPPATPPKPVTPVAAPANTPTAALVSFARAARAGDGDTIKSLVDAESPVAAGMLEVASEYARATTRLKTAVKKKFGDAGVKQLLAIMNRLPLGEFATVAESTSSTAQVEATGDTATVTPQGSDIVFHMVKKDGLWKISAERMLEGYSEERLQTIHAQIDQGLVFFDTLANDVEAGRYSSLKEMMQAVAASLNGR